MLANPGTTMMVDTQVTNLSLEPWSVHLSLKEAVRVWPGVVENVIELSQSGTEGCGFETREKMNSNMKFSIQNKITITTIYIEI
jgi:hypothetical protein